jgi:hypothetical protein
MYVAAANGVVGVSQTVRVSAPSLAGESVGVTLSGGGTTVPLSVSLDAQGLGSVAWTPPFSGNWSVSGAGGATGNSFFVSAVPTATTIFAPTQIQASTPSPNLNVITSSLVASVAVPSGTLTPMGSVQFSYLNGSTIGSAPLVATAVGRSTATLSTWSTPEVGYYNIVATYFPSLGAGGFSNTGSSSDTMQIQTVQAAQPMSLRLPSGYRLGAATTVTAVLNDSTLTGSTAFETNVNGTVTSISASVATSGGSVSAPWTPAALGNQVISAAFSATSGSSSATAQQIISVQPALLRDPISVAPAGGSPWPTGSSIPIATNSRVVIASATQSGSSVSTSSAGACIVSGNTLIATSSAGSCTVTVASPGSSAWASNSATFTFQVSAPSRKR